MGGSVATDRDTCYGKVLPLLVLVVVLVLEFDYEQEDEDEKEWESAKISQIP
jgi:hypothetical protein